MTHTQADFSASECSIPYTSFVHLSRAGSISKISPIGNTSYESKLKSPLPDTDILIERIESRLKIATS